MLLFAIITIMSEQQTSSPTMPDKDTLKQALINRELFSHLLYDRAVAVNHYLKQPDNQPVEVVLESEESSPIKAIVRRTGQLDNLRIKIVTTGEDGEEAVASYYYGGLSNKKPEKFASVIEEIPNASTMEPAHIGHYSLRHLDVPFSLAPEKGFISEGVGAMDVVVVADILNRAASQIEV